VVAAAILAVVYLILEPSTVDLAAQTFRADLFDANGFLLWNNYWYAGHYLLTYSVLFPPLGAWLGPRLVGAIAVVACAALFAAIPTGATRTARGSGSCGSGPHGDVLMGRTA
jgi:hypothetical protein